MEKDAVTKLDQNAYNLVRGLIGPKWEDEEKEAVMRRRVNDALDATAKGSVDRNPFASVLELINDAACRQSLTSSITGLLVELVVALRVRLKELEEQERVFWTRSPTHKRATRCMLQRV